MPTTAVFEPTTEQVVAAVDALFAGGTTIVVADHGVTASDVVKYLGGVTSGYTTVARVEPYLSALADEGALHVTRTRGGRIRYYRPIGA